MLEFPEITALFAGIFAILLAPLTLQVGFKRISTKIMFGDGGDEGLARRRAAQSNFTQYVPFALFLMALAEMASLPTWSVWSFGAIFLISRVCHAYCFVFGDGKGALRAIGMLPILLMIPLLGVALIYGYFVGG